MPTQAPHLYTLQEASDLGYGAYQTLRGYIRDGRLPAVKIGSRVKVRLEDLDALTTPAPSNTTATPPPFDELEAAVRRIAASAPPLTADQVRRLAALFGGDAA